MTRVWSWQTECELGAEESAVDKLVKSVCSAIDLGADGFSLHYFDIAMKQPFEKICEKRSE